MTEDKTWLGFWIVIAGLVAVAAVFVIAVEKYSSAADASTVLGAVTGAIGALVGAFFGVQAGSAGKDKADAARDDAQEKLVALLAAHAHSPEKTKLLLDKFAVVKGGS